ncbi:MAG: CoA transferase [Hyphomicrobiales bacterium]|nr:CoA transferase [Hyphomicrobiales bacterium]
MTANGSKGTLSGLKVVDLSRVLGGPFCTQWFGDLGADVIKVEPPQGDETRDWGPPFDDDGTASYFLGVNRSKSGISVDISTRQGREIILKLLDEADVLIENFRTGTLEKWDLGYETVLKQKFPKLVHCRITGFGADGPLGSFPGYDAVVQAMAGWMSVNGTPDSGPTRLGIAMVDMGTGMAAAIAIMSALYERAASGEGQFVEVSLFDTALSLLFPHGSNYFLSGKRPQPTGNAHPNLAPYEAFKTGTCDIFLGAGNDGQFAKLCDVLKRPELAQDPRFITNADRNVNKVELKQELEALLAAHDGEEIFADLMRKGVPAGPVLGIPEVLAHPHTAHRDMIVEIGAYKGMGNPAKYSRTPSRPTKPPPRFGEHTRDVLRELGYSDADIDTLLRESIVSEPRAAKAAE